MSWRTRWHRLRERITWWCWRKWRGQSRWRCATFDISDKELAQYPRATGKSPAGIGACGKWHDAVDHHELNRQHDDALVQSISDAMDEQVFRDGMEKATQEILQEYRDIEP
jgi:hypothetical protein